MNARVIRHGRSAALLLLAFATIPVAADAQSDPFEEVGRWIEFTAETGLPSEAVDDVTEAADGVPWVVGPEGVAWFDGFRWNQVVVGDWAWTRGRLARLVESRIKPHGDRGVLVVFAARLYAGDRDGLSHVPLVEGGDTLLVRDAVSLGPSDVALYSQKGLYRLDEDGLRPWPASPRDGVTRQGLSAYAGAPWLSTSSGVYAWEGGDWVRHFGTEAALLRVNATGGLVSVEHDRNINGAWTWAHGETPMRLAGQVGGRLIALDMNAVGDAVAVHRDGSVWSRRAGQWRALESVPPALRETRSVSYHSNGDLWVATDGG
ncbi:MAG: hypothetical protein ACR2QM_01750, partial [Longimicrobiales bacterium]